MRVKVPPKSERRKDIPLTDYIWLETISPTPNPPDNWVEYYDKWVRGRRYWFEVKK